MLTSKLLTAFLRVEPASHAENTEIKTQRNAEFP